MVSSARVAACVMALGVVSVMTAFFGCTDPPNPSPTGTDAGTMPDSSSGAGGDGGSGTSSSGSSSASSSSGSSGQGTSNWHLTTYFSAVESFFNGPPMAIVGCMNVDCSAAGDPNNALGTFPDDFVATVEAEGTGKITSGAAAGKFLNWSASQPGSGYWLDTAPRDAQGNALVPYVSAAAHPSVAFGAAFQVLDCGLDQTTLVPMDPQACADFKAGKWEVRDRFENDNEVKHLDLYIGLQVQADMNNDPHFVDQIQAIVTLP